MMFPFLRKGQLRQCLGLLCLASCVLCLWVGPLFHPPVRANTPEPQALVQKGVEQFQAGDYLTAIAAWQAALPLISPDNLNHRSIVFDNLARAYVQVGDFAEAIAHWEQASQHYEQLGALQALGRARVETAQAHSRQGQHRRAIALLCGETVNNCDQGSALQIARALSDVQGEVAALGSLAEAHRLMGNYQTAIELLEQGLVLLNRSVVGEVRSDGSRPTVPPEIWAYRASLFSGLGNSYSALGQVSRRRGQAANERGDTNDGRMLLERADERNQQAITYLRQSYDAARRAQQVLPQVRVQLNLITLYRQTKQLEAIAQAQRLVQQLTATLPDSQEKAMVIITLASSLEPVGQAQQCPAESIVTRQTELLNAAIAIAQSIQSPRAESFALGQLGNLYERCGDYDTALTLTQDARLAADQDRAARDSLYLWVWQQARILQAQGKTAAATETYRRAMAVLETVRADILNVTRELQFDFRDRVEPVYREYAALKLSAVDPSKPIVTDGESEVDSVLVALDSLKLAELQNYFANDCIIAPVATRVDVVGEQSATAVISTVILPHRTAVIASFPNGQRQVEWMEIESKTLADEINDFRRTLEQGRFLQVTFRSPSQQLYRQLIQPFEPVLAALKVDTLVFINDGVLRGIPMAALYDGEQFLIEKFALATTPSLTLTDPNAIDRGNLSALILGLSEPSQVGSFAFPPLNKVEDEIATVEQQFPGSMILKNEDFSESKMREALQEKNYRILHIATHGSFGAEPQDNYIVTGQKLDEQTNKALTISELDALIRSVSSVDRDPIDLLTLTACETAVGDDRANLGLAGVAIRAGVRSAIASLWTVDDAATADLITRFYHYLLDENYSKAEALRAAQLEVIRLDGFTQHPYYWAPFILIGNWL